MVDSENIKVYVVSHAEEDIRSIESDEVYTPLFVGRNGNENFGFCSDDSGDNISYKNPNYCELTGLYWMCKNSPADIIGLVHYRRFFAKSRFGKILSKEDIIDFLFNNDLIIPEKSERLEGSPYDSFKRDELLRKIMDESRETVSNFFPEYVESFDKVMYHAEKTTFFNMFIGRKELMLNYCDWIFPILDDLLEKIDVNDYDRVFSISSDRVYGVLSELLFNVWIEHNKLRVKECPLKYIGFKLSLRMFIINLGFLRKGYKYVYYPLMSKLKGYD